MTRILTFFRGVIATLVSLLFIFAVAPPALAWPPPPPPHSIHVDSVSLNGVTMDGGGTPSITVPTGSVIHATATVTLSGGANWQSTGWRISTTGSGGYACINTTDRSVWVGGVGTFVNSFDVTAPGSPGTYNLYLRAHEDHDNCTGPYDDFHQHDAVIVVVVQNQTIHVTAHAPVAATYGSHFGVAATASSGLPVAITSAGSCSGSGTGSATLSMTSGTGTCTVTYNQAGNTFYHPAPPVVETVTAQPKPIGVLANSATKIYGLPDPALTYALTSSLVGSDTLSGALARDAGEDVGSYAITQGTLTGGPNYDLSFTPNTFTITPADAIVAIVEPTSFTYDGMPHAATVQTTPETGFVLTVTYDGDPTAPTDAGTYAVLAEASSTDPNYNSGTGTGHLTINKAPQTIDFAALPDRSIGAGDFDVSATASSGLPVTFTASGACELTGSGTTVHALSTGTCAITASQAGDANHLAASDVVQSFTVLPLQAPVISPDGYVFHGSIDGVTISSSDTGVTLHYTIDGSTPDCTSPVYTDPFSFVNSTTLSAIACDTSGHESAVTSSLFSPASGGSGGGGSGGGQVLGAAIGPSATTTPEAATSTPAVEPTAPSCAPLLTSYIKLGAKNDVDQVKALQHFLNENLVIALPMTGFYGPLTAAAVKRFQEKYADEVIKPWAAVGFPFTDGTGYVYKTTARWVNILSCGLSSDTDQFPISLP